MDNLFQTIGEVLWNLARRAASFLAVAFFSELLNRTVGRYIVWPIMEWVIIRPLGLALDILCFMTRSLTTAIVGLYPVLDRQKKPALRSFTDARYETLGLSRCRAARNR